MTIATTKNHCSLFCSNFGQKLYVRKFFEDGLAEDYTYGLFATFAIDLTQNWRIWCQCWSLTNITNRISKYSNDDDDDDDDECCCEGWPCALKYPYYSPHNILKYSPHNAPVADVWAGPLLIYEASTDHFCQLFMHHLCQEEYTCMYSVFT